MRRLRFLILIVLVMSACSCGLLQDKDNRVDAGNGDIIGSWRSAKDGSVIDFKEPMGFDAQDVVPFFRGCGCIPPDLGDTKVHGSGSWSLGRGLGQHSGPTNYVYLNITAVDNPQMATVLAVGNDLLVERDKAGAIVLALYVGDPDVNNKIIYTKVT